jgi:hypothetical protein
MAVSRIQIASNKKAAILKQNMREVAVMLAEDPPREEKAKIRAEALIRDDDIIEAYEILQLECELLHERLKLLEYTKDCPKDLVSVVSTLMWASQRVDIPELMLIRKQFRSKYGKTFEEDAMRNMNGVLNERVVAKLSVEPPAAYLVQTYLERICEQFQVDWKPAIRLTPAQMIEPMAAPVGYSVAVAQGSGLGPVASPYNPTTLDIEEEERALKLNGGIPPSFVVTATPVSPPDGSNDFGEPDIYIPGAPTSGLPGNGSAGYRDNDDDGPPTSSSGNGSSQPSTTYADLASRFDSLKR